MPNSLYDMFQPTNAAGEQSSFGNAIASRSNSLIGMGLGLMGATQPGLGEALHGYQVGSSQDAQQAARLQALAHQKRQEGFQRDQAKQAQSNWQKQFDRGDPANAPTEFTRAARDLGLTPGTPEHSQFAKQYYSTKSEGNLAAQAEQRQAIAKNLGMDPADPKTRAWIAGGGTLNEKPRDLSMTDITKLSEEGSKLSSLGTFHSTFEPRFAGRPFYGEAANLAGRTLPEGVVGKDVADSATWWQGYDQYKNVVRHDLYGGALTPTEVTVFEKANITPGMDPKQIEKNLATQKEVVLNGVRRKANAMIAAGYDPATIANAYGVNLKDIGVTATGRGGSAAPPTAAATEATSSGAPPTAGRGGSAPQRPANVPQGSYYSPSRNQWKLPDGTIVDAAGRPI